MTNREKKSMQGVGDFIFQVLCCPGSISSMNAKERDYERICIRECKRPQGKKTSFAQPKDVTKNNKQMVRI